MAQDEESPALNLELGSGGRRRALALEQAVAAVRRSEEDVTVERSGRDLVDQHDHALDELRELIERGQHGRRSP